MTVSPDIPPDEAPRGPARPGAIVVQGVALAISIGLLVWSASLALSSENRENLEQLRDAPPAAAVALVALVLLSVVCNGVIFQIVLGHTRRLGVIYLTGVTAIATLVAYAPFKLSLVARALIHRRHDAMAYRTLVSWFVATAGLSLCVIAPVTAASAWRPQLDLPWAALTFGVPIAMLLAAVLVARRVRTMKALNAVTLGSAEYATTAWRVGAVGAIRYLDLGAMALRFYIAADLLGVEMSVGQSLVAASVYFLTGLLSPSGNLGAREGAVTGAGFLPAMGGHEEMALVALTVTGAEVIGAIIAGGIGALIVRPDRLLRVQPPAPSEDTSVSEARAER